MVVLNVLSMLLAVLFPNLTLDSTWFETEGRDEIEASVATVYPDMSSAEIEALTFSSAVPVGLISDDGLNAENVNRLAVVIIADEPIGVAVANPTAEKPLIGVYDDDRLTSVVSGLGGGDKLYFDEDLGVYFLQVEDSIEPASAGATEYILGPIPTDMFMQIRSDLVVEGMPAAQLEPAQEADSNPIMIVMIVLAIALVAVLVVTWLRASSEEEESVEDTTEHRRKPEPARATSAELGLTPVMTVTADLIAVRRIKAGDGVSYGHTFVADRDMTVGTVPLGYADGIPRLASNRMWVSVDGVKAPIRGRICMDQFIVELPDHIEPGHTVTVLGGDGPSADEWAHATETINYEIVTRLGSRVPRVRIEA